jgi:hypothetical protein
MNKVVGCHREVMVAAMMDTINLKRKSMNSSGSSSGHGAQNPASPISLAWSWRVLQALDDTTEATELSYRLGQPQRWLNSDAKYDIWLLESLLNNVEAMP